MRPQLRLCIKQTNSICDDRWITHADEADHSKKTQSCEEAVVQLPPLHQIYSPNLRTSNRNQQAYLKSQSKLHGKHLWSFVVLLRCYLIALLPPSFVDFCFVGCDGTAEVKSIDSSVKSISYVLVARCKLTIHVHNSQVLVIFVTGQSARLVRFSTQSTWHLRLLSNKCSFFEE